jgi:hypothetical protein
MRIVDTDDHVIVAGIVDQPVDHLTHPSQRIGAEVTGNVGERAQWEPACRCRADNPVPTRIPCTAVVEGFTRQPGLADTGGAGEHDPAGSIGGCAGGVGDHPEFR